MSKTVLHLVLAAGLGSASAAIAAPVVEPTAKPESARPSTSPVDPMAPTGSATTLPKGDVPRGSGDIARPATTPPAHPSGPAGIIVGKDVPGQPAAPPSAQPSGKDAKAAQKAVTELHKSNQLEMALGSLARERATGDAVREYAKELVELHQDADRKLAERAGALGLALPSGGAVAAVHDAPSVVGPSGGSATGQQGASGSHHGSVGVTGMTAPGATPGAAAPGAGTPGTGTGVGSSGSVAGTTPSPSTTGTPRPPGSNREIGSSIGRAAGDRVAAVSDIAVSPPPALDAEARRMVARLEKMEGQAFDKEFLRTMVKSHGKTLSQIKGFERQLKTHDLASFLGEARAMVEGHLARAKELQKGASTTVGAL